MAKAISTTNTDAAVTATTTVMLNKLSIFNVPNDLDFNQLLVEWDSLDNDNQHERFFNQTRLSFSLIRASSVDFEIVREDFVRMSKFISTRCKQIDDARVFSFKEKNSKGRTQEWAKDLKALYTIVLETMGFLKIDEDLYILE
jgi:hypothetical protein